MEVVKAQGSNEKIGFDIGRQIKEEIKNNLLFLEQEARPRNLDPESNSIIRHGREPDEAISVSA